MHVLLEERTEPYRQYGEESTRRENMCWVQKFGLEHKMHSVNEVVNVNAFYFLNGQSLKSFPKEIEFGTTRCTFSDGLQYLVKKGTSVIRLFDMTDGRTTYRLRLEDDTWTLVGTRSQRD